MNSAGMSDMHIIILSLAGPCHNPGQETSAYVCEPPLVVIKTDDAHTYIHEWKHFICPSLS